MGGGEGAVPKDRKAVKAGLQPLRREGRRQEGTNGYLGQRGPMRKFTETPIQQYTSSNWGGIFFRRGKKKRFQRWKYRRCWGVVCVFGDGREGRGSSEFRGKVIKGKRPKGNGDQAYAPFGAGRETGHQVPVVAAKIERDRYREPDEHPMQRRKKREGGRRGLINGNGEGDFPCAAGASGCPY